MVMSCKQLQVLQAQEENTGPFAHQLLQLAKLHFHPQARPCWRWWAVYSLHSCSAVHALTGHLYEQHGRPGLCGGAAAERRVRGHA